MLPDFPRLKEELHRMLVLGMRVERPETSPLLAGFASHHMHEGDRAVLVRENGEEQEIPLHEYTAEEMVDLTEVELPTLAESYKRYLDAVSRIEKEVAADIEDLVDRAAESVGNVVDLGGRPLPEGILEGVENMLLLGDPRNVDQLFDLLQVQHMLRAAPAEAVEEAREQMKSGSYKEQTEKLLDQKREEYRVRESRRQLVG
jgi:hypothetical protein